MAGNRRPRIGSGGSLRSGRKRLSLRGQAKANGLVAKGLTRTFKEAKALILSGKGR